MYMEFKVKSGILCYKTSPHGEWHMCSREQITIKYVEAMERIRTLEADAIEAMVDE